MQIETEPTVLQREPMSDTAQPTSTRGLLFVLSAPSGTGKDTVIHALKQQGMDFHVVASVTTRNARPSLGESEGNPYYFVSQERFQQMIAQGELFEYANVHGEWYGQPIQPIRDNLQAGRDVLLKIDVQGAATIRRKVPGAIFIFLEPGSIEELITRLNHRQTETEAELQRRLADAHKELAERTHYDYVVMNRQGELQQAVEHLRAILLAEHCRVHPRSVEI